jgi:quinol monooxygenase YgiN
MTKTAFYAKHKALPGKREDVRQVWEKYVRDYIADAEVQLSYVYSYDENDLDTIVAFQVCTDKAGVEDFLKQPWFKDYSAEMAELIAGPSEYRTLTPVWIKGEA